MTKTFFATVTAMIVLFVLFGSSACTKSVPTPVPTPIPTPVPDYLGPNARALYILERILPLLDMPDKVSAFMKNNIKWDGDYDTQVRGSNEYAPANVVCERGVDDCDGHAILQAYLLERNGGMLSTQNRSVLCTSPDPVNLMLTPSKPKTHLLASEIIYKRKVILAPP